MSFHELPAGTVAKVTTTNNIFFGDLSIGSLCLRALLNMMNGHKSLFKAEDHLN